MGEVQKIKKYGFLSKISKASDRKPAIEEPIVMIISGCP
tara:strand:+ start:207 stop:323 length:117 start_codon:yes stop_codon:yes gene_type:complete